MNNNVNYTRAEDLKRLSFIDSVIAKFKTDKLKVLDIGCGNGNISRYIGSKGHLVTGIDISKSAIDKAIELNEMKNVAFFNISAENLNSNQKFDLIICSEVIEHLNIPENVISTLKNLLKHKGVLIVTVPNGFGPREVLITKPIQWLKKNKPSLFTVINNIKSKMGFTGQTIQSDADDLTHVQFFTKKSLTNLISKHNLKLINFDKSNFVETVFPFSLFTKRSITLQKLDCKLASLLPHYVASGFMSAWQMKK
jgi:2-polyprenyl-3-methyl-5-hydroxy-6-metoxy-1,4-benzoquinol methylase